MKIYDEKELKRIINIFFSYNAFKKATDYIFEDDVVSVMNGGMKRDTAKLKDFLVAMIREILPFSVKEISKTLNAKVSSIYNRDKRHKKRLKNSNLYRMQYESFKIVYNVNRKMEINKK